MRDTGLLQLALGVAPPWTVASSDFDTAARRLDIYIDFTTGSRFTCPSCGAADCPAHDTEQVTWRHPHSSPHFPWDMKDSVGPSLDFSNMGSASGLRI
jgi:hypothetical protein